MKRRPIRRGVFLCGHTTGVDGGIGHEPDPNPLQEIHMQSIKQIVVSASLVTMALALGGCAGMSNQDKNTAVGAGIGAVAGSVLTGGSPIGAVGGAAVGGVIGNQVKSSR
jgi:osmotically inducible lipoprotein OsmB